MTSKIAMIIDRERTKLGLSQIEVLKKAEMNPKAVGRTWERLRNNEIRLSDAFKICKAVGVRMVVFDKGIKGESIDGELIPDEKINLQGRRK